MTGDLDANKSLWPGLCGQDEDGAFLIGSRCDNCGFVAVSERSVCPQCWTGDNLSEARVGRRGRLYTCSVVHATPPGYNAPYSVGYVDLEDGIRIFAHLEMGVDAAQIGDSVELTVAALRTDQTGSELFGPRYRRPQEINRA